MYVRVHIHTHTHRSVVLHAGRKGRNARYDLMRCGTASAVAAAARMTGMHHGCAAGALEWTDFGCCRGWMGGGGGGDGGDDDGGSG